MKKITKEQAANYCLEFGKYAGQPLKEVVYRNRDYLVYILAHLTEEIRTKENQAMHLRAVLETE